MMVYMDKQLIKYKKNAKARAIVDELRIELDKRSEILETKQDAVKLVDEISSRLTKRLNAELKVEDE